MAAKHRKRSRQVKKIAAVVTATATVSALTMGAVPAPTPPRVVTNDVVDLATAIRLLPNSNQVPDITFGLGSIINTGSQAIADQVTRAVVNGINLAALAQAAGVDPRSLVNSLLADLPANLLPGILAALALDLPLLGPILNQVPGIAGLLTQVLDLLGVDDALGGSLTGLLALIGLNLSSPLGQAGVNIVTAGPTFSVLNMLGFDLGWTPAQPNSVAHQINHSEYLKIGVHSLLTGLLYKLEDDPLIGILDPFGIVRGNLAHIIDDLTANLPDILDLRVVPTIGIGLGAFAAAMAYEQVIADLRNQPGGPGLANNPLLGSLTVLPMILVNNPARPDGGLFARFGPLAELFGIDTVNPTTELTGVGGVAGPLGLHLGGANVLPIMIDATFEYQAMSDFASWPNVFTLANNLASALLPTYMLRGLTLDGLDDQLFAELGQAVREATDLGTPLSLNVYLTLHSKTLPLLEPLYLAADFLNLVGLSPLAQIPLRLANALAPALRILTDIGYANVVQHADGTYTRDFLSSGIETPFLSFANIDYGRAIGDAFGALLGGVQKEFFSGNPTPSGPNVLQNLLNALLGTDLLGGVTSAVNGLVSGMTGAVNGLLAGLGHSIAPASIRASRAVGEIPDVNARFSALSLPAGPEAEIGSDATESTGEKPAEAKSEGEGQDGQGQPAEGEGTETVMEPPAVQTSDEQTEQQPAAEEESAAEDTDAPAAEKPAEERATTPKHAKPESQDEPAQTEVKATTPKHAKPDTDAQTATIKPDTTGKPSLSVVRDTANAFSPKDKSGPVAESKGNEGKGAATASASASASDASSAGASSDGGASDAA